MAQLESDGVRLYYEVHGEDSAPAVLLSHGYGATAAMWDAQIEDLSAHYRLITWDMRGHGRSDSPDDPALYSEAATVADMAAILDECGVGRSAVGGLSLGGYMSLAFWVAQPARTSALLLFDTGPGYRNDEARDGWNRNAVQRAQRLEERGLDAVGGGTETRVARHRSATGLAQAARGMLAQQDSRIIDALPGIDVPTLVLVGENDTPFLGASDYMAKKIPGAVKVVIPDAGHAANIDQPAAFSKAVLDFFATTG